MAYVEYEADGKTIKARVQQKTDTLANWMANDNIVLAGEQAFVVNDDGTPLNFKIGDGTKPFRDLPNWIDFSNAQRVSSVAPGVVPAGPAEETKYMEVTEIGTYTYGGNTLAEITEDGYKATFWWTGTEWISNGVVRVMGETPPISDEVVSGGLDATSQDAVYKFISDKGSNYGDKVVSNYTTDFPGASLTVLYSKIFETSEPINNSLIYSPVAGKVMLKTFSKSGSIVTMSQSKEVTLVSGVNEVNWGLIVPTGGMIGYSCNDTTLTGRIGFNTSSPRADIHILTADSNNFTLPAKAAAGSIGLYVEYGNTGLLPRVSSIEDEIKKISGNDITNSFVTQIGGLTPNYTANGGYMTLGFTTGNQSVVSNGALGNGVDMFVKFTAKTLSGTIQIVIGQFTSTITPPITTKVTIDSVEKTFTLAIRGNTSGGISIGALAADNTGSTFLIKDIVVFSQTSLEGLDERVSELEGGGASSVMPRSFNLSDVLFSLSKYDKKLIVVTFVGDSLFANPTGGDIPDVEPLTQRPIRLGQSNNLARRFYDYMSWNKPQWRRLDDSSWTKSGWTLINTTSIFEPTYTNETYHTASGVAEASITVPSGNENFAFVYRVGNTSGNIDVYVNNILRTTLNTNKATAGHTGNPYKIYHIDDLGAGSNTIKLVRSGSNPIYIWGGAYWTGNTLMVMNVGHGGHTLAQLNTQHIDDEVVDNKPDAIVFEHTLMNDTARMADSGNTILASETALNSILDKFLGKDLFSMSCHPFGTDPQDGTPNYYANYPGMEQMKNALKRVSFDRGIPYLDIFELFKLKILAKGGTLEGGQGGLWYTWDGQHQNEVGMREFWNMIKGELIKNPIKIG